MIPVTITAKAVEEIKNMMTNKNVPQGYGLRVLVQGGGGCGGAKFKLGFDKQREGDTAYIFADIPIFYEKRQMMYLLGLEIDFEERNNERGFVFATSPLS